MSVSGGHLLGAGGRQIFWQSWASDRARAVVVIVHGAGEHLGRYEHVAERLVADRYAVYALDHRGHGRSDGPRALIDRMGNAISDLDALVALARGSYPQLPVFMIGHSMGGLLAIQYALEHPRRLAGLILSGALVALDAAPARDRLAARLLSAVTPRLGLVAVDASLISRDPQVVAAYRADPLVHHGKLPARTIAELIATGTSFPDRVARIAIPTLVMWGTEDGLSPPHGSEMLVERVGADDLTAAPYPGLYHEIFNEPERRQVLDDVCAWLDARAPQASA